MGKTDVWVEKSGRQVNVDQTDPDAFGAVTEVYSLDPLRRDYRCELNESLRIDARVTNAM